MLIKKMKMIGFIFWGAQNYVSKSKKILQICEES